MDAAGAPMLPPDASPPPYAGGQGAAFPIAIVIAIGFMVTSLILISYYFLVVRCWLRGAGAGGGPGSALLHRARREDLVERVSAVFFTDYEPELPGGLDPDVVAALPVVKYRRMARSAAAPAPVECAVCLAEFAPEERLKQLPSCSHAFHIDCIDTWLHHNVSCPLCRTVVTGGVPLARDDHEESCRDLRLHVGDDGRITGAAPRVGHGSSCRFPAKAAGAAQQEPMTRSFSMDCFAGGLGRKPLHKEKEPAAAAGTSEAGPSSSSNSVIADRGAGETSGRFRRLLSSFGLGRSSRTTVLPIHLDP